MLVILRRRMGISEKLENFNAITIFFTEVKQNETKSLFF